MPSHILKVGARGSRLAQVQVEEIFSLLAQTGTDAAHTLTTYQTRGDHDKSTSLLISPADDFFTDTLDEAVLKGEIDAAVHSAKDLPKALRPGLKIFALTASRDERDAFVGRKKLSELEAGAKIGTSSALRKDGILAINPAVQIIDIRGTIQERLKFFKDGHCDGLIVAACALKRLGLESEITEIMPWEGTPLQGQLAVVGRDGDGAAQKVFAAIDVRKTYGRVTLAGAGPGDPELITVKAIKALKKADCIFYDYLVHENLLDYAPDAEKINAGKRKGGHTMPQAELSRLLRQKAMAGKTVVRLKGGDPFIFGRGAEEIAYLRSYHIGVDVIPGITSATGIPSSLGIPLTARGVSSSVAFVSAHTEDESDTAPQPVLIPHAETLVFFMGLTKLPEIVRSLRAAGWKDTTPAVVISKGTRADEKVVPGSLRDMEDLTAKENLSPPALIIVGETVKFFQNGSRFRERILYLGTNPEKYKSLGTIIPHPMIAISPAPIDPEDARNLLEGLPRTDMILLTSRFAVRYFFEFLRQQGFERKALRAVDFAVIGADTARALVNHGFCPLVTAEEETSAGLLSALEKSRTLHGKRIVFPRSSLPNPFLKTELEKRGSIIDEITIYQNTKPPKRELPAGPIDKILFTSPSTVGNFLQDYGRIPREWRILAKGSRTREALAAAGYSSEVLVFA